MNKEKTMIELANTIEKCQRNFDWSKPLPNKHVKTILNVASSMPTKQQLQYYHISAIENEAIAREFYTTCTQSDGTPYANSQTYAPLLLIWTCNKNYQDHDPYNDVHMAVGISSAAAALTAANLGYKTGFCKCIDKEMVVPFYKKHFGKTIVDPCLALGIGHPLDGYTRHDAILDDKIVTTIPSNGTKNISTFRYSSSLSQ